MKIPYYPGCTLNTVAKAFDLSAKESARALDFEMAELTEWNCCGATFPMTPDNIMGLTAPAKVIVNARKAGDCVTTLCSVCYNVLKRTNKVLKDDREKCKTVTEFIEEEYDGGLQVLHYLEILRDRVGFDKVKETVTRPLTGLKIASYYGCMLLRPFEDMGIDNHESPTVMEDLVTSLGAKAVDFPNKIECCGAHLAMSNEGVVEKLSASVIDSAVSEGAELIVTSCPLCQYNLEKTQEKQAASKPGYRPVPIVYFTQLLGLALGQGDDMLGFADNKFDARPLLKEREV